MYRNRQEFETDVFIGGAGWWFDNDFVDITENATCFSISGKLFFVQSYNNKQIEDSYIIKIDFPYNYPNELPRTFEMCDRIPNNNDWHNCKSTGLCLATPAEMRYRIQSMPKTFTAFVSSFVIPFLFANSFKEDNGEYPWDASEHGISGIIEEYKSFYKIHDDEQIVKFLTELFKKDNPIKGHVLCPCGNGKKFRDCHMKKLYERMEYYAYEDMKHDYDRLVEAKKRKFNSETEIRRIISKSFL